MQEQEERMKKCFIITPIGNDNTSIRRHIDGIIDGCIIPVLENNYDVVVAHRLTTPGSINNQVIEAIYKADLVIANLTELNPNVMYELAFRHSLKKPVIIIMEKGEHKLPFDINNERTIFYENDFQGAIDLKNRLEEMVSSIEKMDEEDINNPIYDALQQIGVKENVLKNINNSKSDNVNELQYIISRLDNIEEKIVATKLEENKNMRNFYSRNFQILMKIDDNIKSEDEIKGLQKILEEKLIQDRDLYQVLNLKYTGKTAVVYLDNIDSKKQLTFIMEKLRNIPGWKVL